MTDPNSASTRRFFLQASAATAGGLLVGCRALPSDADAAVPGAAAAPAPAPATPTGPGLFGIYVEITPDNVVYIVTPQSEMGQGVHDGMPKLIADELDADWARVQVRMPWTDDRFVSPVTKRHRTAQSDSTTGYFATLRQVGAATREMLVAAAAARWQVPADQCTTANSVITHGPTNRTLSYGEVAAAAAALPVPATPRLKAPADFKLIGTSTLRKDTPPKCDGSAVYGIDVRRPNMLYAALRFSPAVRTKLVSFDREAVLKLSGVVDAFEVGDAVAVVARSTWQALKAAEALDAKFDDTAAGGAETETMRKRMIAALDNDSAALPGFPYVRKMPYDKAKTLEAIAAAPIRKEWTYEVPFLAHAALEPLTATAQYTDDGIQVWAPSQHPDGTRNMLAQLTGLPKDKCRMDVTFIGGGFGRKWELDFVRQAAQIAMKMKGTPVKLTWTREQDYQHDFYRPAHVVRTRVGLGRDGAVLGIHSRTTGISMWKVQGRPLPPGRGDIFALGLLINDRYDVANPYTDFVESPEPIPVGTWRSVSLSMNGFFAESGIDDIAAALREDPLKLRQRLLANDPRSLAALNLAAEKAGWGKPLPRGRGRGIAFTSGFDSYCAQVVEVTVKGKAVKVDRIVCAFDCGLMVDPHNVEAQVEGGIVWGLSAALSGQIQFANGGAAHSNFADAPILRINEMPKIEVHLMRTDHKPGGAGEASVPPVAAALAQAIFAATGRRPRRMPIIASGFELT
jgi:isoquinoline 1-oxidoreductase subunit beta